MKKRLIGAFLLTAMVFTLLPTMALAAPTVLNSVDITIELPKGGDPFDPSYEPTITLFKSGNIDLLAGGAGFLTTYWSGDYDTDEYGNPYFRTGGSYTLTLKLMFGSGYCAASTKSSTTGETVVSPENFSATVNGVTATVTRNSSSYYPSITVNLTLEGEVLSETEKGEKNAEWETLKQTRRAMLPSRTWEEAETYNFDNYPDKLLTVTSSDGKEIDTRCGNSTILIMDTSNAPKLLMYVANCSTLREIWLSPQVDPYQFISAMASEQFMPGASDYNYVGSAAIPLYLAEGTVFIPESRVSEYIQACKDRGYPGTAFSLKSYSGSDVYAAQKAGASAAKEFCTNHSYTTQIRSADRVYHFADCNDSDLFYYSCAYCGKCENNPNHVDYDWVFRSMGYLDNLDMTYGATQRHPTHAELPADSSYIGVNAAGNHVWYLGCEYCGVFDRYNINEYDYEGSGNALNFEDYKAAWQAALKQSEAQALNSTERYPGTFTLPLKSDAKMSEWAQSDVNLALNDDLIDDAILGKDYTKNITRLQFCSIAVKLAETLIGKELTPAASGTFKDTDNIYVRKAYAAGITTGTSATTFDPNGTLTRQQMATFIYRTLRYVEQNSDYKYTEYESMAKLSTYSDALQVQSWAKEAMTFMNALDLVKGTSDTTIAPNGICTIEQALAVAERSVYAHLLGWYQVGRATAALETSSTISATMDGYELREGDYIWVTGCRYGVSNTYVEKRDNLPYVTVPVLNPFNGQASEIENGALVPVRN